MSRRIGLWAAGIAFAVALPATAAVETDMSGGGITFSSGDNSLTLGARAQFRWTVDDKEAFDADTAGAGLGVEDGASSAFDVPRMRISLKGGVFRPWLKYEFQFELGRTGGDAGSRIKDAFVDLGANPRAMVRFGQFKAPFSLQQLTSSGRLQFVDRAITDSKFVPGRDTGVMLTGVAANKTFGYAVGAFNGSGEARVQEDQGHLFVGRVWFDPLGEYKLSESANDHPEKPVLHFGLGARVGEVQKGTASPGVFEDPNDETAMNFEVAFKRGRFSATGEYFRMTDELANPASGPDVDADGWNVQVGFMVAPRKVEVGVRWAQIDPDDRVANDDVTEWRGVFGYYFKGHNLKIQADVGEIGLDAGYVAACGVPSPGIACRNLPSVGPRLASGELTDRQLRVQLQLAY